VSKSANDEGARPVGAGKRAAEETERPRPLDPSRRLIARRTASAILVAGAAGLGAGTFFDHEKPVRTRPRQDKTIPDHRVQVPPTTPSLIVARGQDPAKNVAAALRRMGGMALFVKKGDLVVVKPNVGWDRKPEQAANTNPQVVAAVVRACLEAGAAKVVVADHPVNDAERCFTRSGILEAARAAGGKVEIPAEGRFQFVEIPGKLGRWPVFEPFIAATKLINIPIVKHHSLTRATLGMKNWYGILGGRRNQLHQRIDDSVAELAALMRPTLTVVDATRLLVRNGPTGGSLADVKTEGAVAVSRDPIAADAWAATLLELDPGQLSWLKLGESKKLGVVDFRSLSPIEITT
jgi:uncharacterized protein (DUF362 family)